MTPVPALDRAPVITRTVPAPAEDVWAALTEPGVVRTWLGELAPPFRVGRLSQLEFADGDQYALETFEMSPPYRLTCGWRRFGIDVKETIGWEISPRPGGCVVTVSHSAAEAADGGRSAVQQEWLARTGRLESCLAGQPVPPAAPDREFVLSTELPGRPGLIQERLDEHLRKLLAAPLRPRDGDEPGEVEVTARGETLLLTHPAWPCPTSCRISVTPRAQVTRLTVRHWGWEGTGFDAETRIRHRRRFAAFWHRFLLLFTLDYARSWQIPTISAADLSARLDQPEVFVFDANRATLWERGHLPRAAFVGQEDLPLDRLPADKDAQLVFYCRDTMCLTAYLSAAQARTLGYANTVVMEGGRQAWAQSGFPLVPVDGMDVLEPDQADGEGA